jgi:hypothetical protein
MNKKRAYSSLIVGLYFFAFGAALSFFTTVFGFLVGFVGFWPTFFFENIFRFFPKNAFFISTDEGFGGSLTLLGWALNLFLYFGFGVLIGWIYNRPQQRKKA